MTDLKGLKSLVVDLGVAVDVSGLDKPKIIKQLEDYLDKEIKGEDKGTVALLAINSFLDDLTDTKPPVKGATARKEPESIGKIRLHREFKISGSIDIKAGISYTSVIRQVESGLAKGYTEADIVDGIIRATPAASGLRNYLEGREDLDLANLRGLLRAHYNEKSATERYSELGAAKQNQTETPTEFLMRCLDLRNKILFASRESSSELKYSTELVKGLFQRTVYTGLQDLSVRQEFRGVLSDGDDDQQLIHELNQIVSREAERKKKFNMKDCYLKTVETAAPAPTDEMKTQMKDLQGQLCELKVMVANMARQERDKTSGRARRRRGCSACEEAGTTNQCRHCFRCGSSKHQIKDCNQGNEKGLSRRGAEQP